MPIHPVHRLAPLAAAAALAASAVAAGPALARHGSDDPPAHDVGDDHGGATTTVDDPATHDAGDDRGGQRAGDDRATGHRGRGVHHRRRDARRHAAQLRHGADDGAGHARHRGDDDGPRHT